jgi:hypothetical protein
VVKYQILAVVLAVTLAVAIAWAAVAAGSTRTVVRVSKPAASPPSVTAPSGNGDLCRPYHGHC